MNQLVRDLKNRRISLRKTQKEIADKIFVAQNTLSEYENERKELKLTILQDLANELEGKIEFIPNEKITNMYLHQINISTEEEDIKNIFKSEEFNNELNSLLNEIYSISGYTDTLEDEYYYDDIIVSKYTIENDMFEMSNEKCLLKTKVMEERYLNNINNTFKNLFSINSSTSNDLDLLIAEKVYDFIFDYLYEKSPEINADFFIKIRSVLLYTRVEEKTADNEFEYFIR